MNKKKFNLTICVFFAPSFEIYVETFVEKLLKYLYTANVFISSASALSINLSYYINFLLL